MDVLKLCAFGLPERFIDYDTELNSYLFGSCVDERSFRRLNLNFENLYPELVSTSDSELDASL